MKAKLILYTDPDHRGAMAYQMEVLNYELNHSFLIMYFSNGEVGLLSVERIHSAYFWPEGVEPPKAQRRAFGAAKKKKRKKRR